MSLWKPVLYVPRISHQTNHLLAFCNPYQYPGDPGPTLPWTLSLVCHLLTVTLQSSLSWIAFPNLCTWSPYPSYPLPRRQRTYSCSMSSGYTGSQWMWSQTEVPSSPLIFGVLFATFSVRRSVCPQAFIPSQMASRSEPTSRWRQRCGA